MKRFLPFALAVFTTFCLLLATDRKAYGYVDPGSGFLALQTGASVIAACGYFFRKHLVSLFAAKPNKTPTIIAGSIQKGESRNAA